MAGIAGLLITSKRNDADSLLKKMSETIRHRKCESFHTMTHNNARCLIVGSRSFQNTEDELFIIDRNEDIAFSEESDDVTSISAIFGVAAVIVDNRGVSLLRSLDGTRALYYGTTENLFAFASERKSLWNIDITSLQVLEPGQGITHSWDGNLVSERFASLDKPTKTEASREETLDVLRKALLDSFQRLGRDTACGVLFSGGVDSSLVAVLAARQCENTILVTTRSKGAHDDTAATEAATRLGLPLHTVELNSEIIWETLPEVIYSIETSRQMDVEIALPFYLASKKAAEEGCTTVVSGQGPDELFAGYAKHVKTYTEKGPDSLAEQLWKEVSITHETNIERDDRAIAAHGVESFFPYLDQLFVHNSLSVPVEWKMSPDGTPQRKVIFRELAQLLGVPVEIALAPKSATQYSSGSSKAILESVIEHVDGFSYLSKKKVARKVQDVLDEIACEIQMPNVQDKKRGILIDLGSVRMFLKRRESSSSGNTW
ncbi:MAG: asparagine synthetase B [Candidatus Thorarchaeota archaeon]|nr:asparagine synthetase B [Candidatus Thorarchaeota archaeon]